MDERRFDALAREWVTSPSRRALTCGLAALAAGGGIGLGHMSQITARKRKKKKKAKKRTPCPQGSVLCGETCVETARDDANCGGCGVRCTPGNDCCGGHCRDRATDAQHCGACGVACAPGDVCCGGACRDLARDPENCGACGETCATNQVCLAGTCTRCDVCEDGCPATFVQEAVNAANPHDTILLCPGTWTGAVTIRKDLTIIGAGSGTNGSILTEPELFATLVLVEEGATVELINLAVAGAPESASSSSIINKGRLTLTECQVRGHSHLNLGGGIFNAASATLILRHTIVSGNRVAHSAGKGGGIFNNGGEVTLEQSDVRDNIAGESGGGIYNETHGVVTLIESTISGNEATIQGGGIANYGDLTLRDSTVQTNKGGGLFNFGTVALTGTSRVTGNVPTNCQGTPVCAP